MKDRTYSHQIEAILHTYIKCCHWDINSTVRTSVGGKVRECLLFFFFCGLGIVTLIRKCDGFPRKATIAIGDAFKEGRFSQLILCQIPFILCQLSNCYLWPNTFPWKVNLTADSVSATGYLTLQIQHIQNRTAYFSDLPQISHNRPPSFLPVSQVNIMSHLWLFSFS